MKKIYPFKFLDNYSKDDTEIFFGRNEEIDSLYEMIFQTDILLIYGASGTGKTSLIQCGLAKKFKTHDWLSIYVRRGTNLNVSLEKKLAEEGASDEDMDLDWLDEISDDAGAERSEISPIQRSLRNIYQNSFKPVYLIFDQFEELYLLGTKQEQKQFIDSVKEILEMEQPVKMIFSIREEFLYYLYEFERAVPELLRKKLRVEPMNIDKVQQVITGVTTLENSIIHIKKGELEAITKGIFERLKGKNELTIQLPYLQVFLDKFYLNITSDQTRQSEAVFSNDVLNSMGNIGNVLSKFLEDQVKAVSQELKKKYVDSNEQKIWDILSPFASSKGTKVPTSISNLYKEFPDIAHEMIDEVIAGFIQNRILRKTEGEDLYEITHDSLAGQIAKKRGTETTTRIEVKELIKSQVGLKEEARELFSEKQLGFIMPWIDKLVLEPEEQKLIDESQEAIENKRNEELNRERREREKEQAEFKKKRKQQRKVNVFIGAMLVVAVIALIVAVVYYLDAEEKEKEAVENLNIARAALATKDSLNFVNLEKRAQTILKAGGYPKEILEDMDSIANMNRDSTILRNKIKMIERQVKPEYYK